VLSGTPPALARRLIIRNVDLVEPPDGQLALPIDGAKQPSLAIVAETGFVEVGIDVGLGEMGEHAV
jgi:hypothetical protein